MRVSFRTRYFGAKRPNRSRKTLSALLLALGGYLLSAPASASLIFDSSVLLSAQDFGNAPHLTIQHTGRPVTNDFESGCVGVSGGVIVVGPAGCRTSDVAIDPNGVIPVGGDEPASHNDKYGIPTFGSLGITNANQIGILFNATEPGGNAINVTDITLSIFGRNSAFITSINGQQSFASTDPGNGVAGFVFRVNATEAAQLNALVFSQPTFASDMLALSSSLTGATGGPDTFRIVNLGSSTCTGNCGALPEPATPALVGLGLIGLAAQRRRRKN